MSVLDHFKDKRIYHCSDSDLDGVSARIIAEWYIKPICKTYVPLNTAERDMSDFDIEEAKKHEVIIFSDITPTPELYKILTEDLKLPVFIFDHHLTGKEKLGDIPNYFYDLHQCGCEILFNEVTKGKRVKRVIKQFVELVSTYDLWKNKDELWKRAQSLHFSLFGYVKWKYLNYETDTQRHLKFITVNLLKFSRQNEYKFTNTEMAIIKNAKKKITDNYEQAMKTLNKRTDKDGRPYAYFECSSKISFVASKILEENTDLDYVACRALWAGKKSVKMSLRARDGINVRPIAESYGGGGHNEACGFEFPDVETMQKFKEGTLDF